MSTMPTPPARSTSWLFSTRALTPRSQTTIFPATLAGSSEFEEAQPQRRSRGRRPRRPRWTATSGELGTAGPRPTPVYVVPLPRVTDLTAVRSWVLAATVVSHGLLCATVLAPGPAVAGRGGDEDARLGGAEERELDRVDEAVQAAGDRVVDDVHAVGGRVLDRLHAVGVGAAGLRLAPGPSRPCRSPRRALRRHAAGPAEVGAVDDDRDAVVAGRRASRCGCRGRPRPAGTGTRTGRRRWGRRCRRRSPRRSSARRRSCSCSPQGSRPRRSGRHRRTAAPPPDCRSGASDGDSGHSPVSITPTTTP